MAKTCSRVPRGENQHTDPRSEDKKKNISNISYV